jgi:glycosyltransferase involved in cell wall biosynthesis
VTWTVLDLGPEPAEGVERWNGDARVSSVIRIVDPAPTGRRFGSRAFGLGLDALRVALRARYRGISEPVIAMNPWTSVAARLLGFRNVATVGLYAVEGGRSWMLLRRVIGTRPVVTLSEHEATRWRSSGGCADAVKYGSTFADAGVSAGLRNRTKGGPLSIFIGGSSDRDAAAVDDLIATVRATKDDSVRLVVATGGAESSDAGNVRRVGDVPQHVFSRLIEESDIVYLPLADNGRAAGHMVLVEALQRGKPVVATWVAGMNEYFDDRHVVRAQAELLTQLRDLADSFAGQASQIREYWLENHSSQAFGQRILDALDGLAAEASR